MEEVVLVVAGLMIPEMFRVIIVFADKSVVEIFETVITWPAALQPIAVERELLADKDPLTVQGPGAIVMLVGRVIATKAPAPSMFLVCITKE
jgi:hypothetical protein